MALLESNEGNRGGLRDQQQGSEEANAHVAPARIKCHMSVISLHLAKLCQAIFPHYTHVEDSTQQTTEDPNGLN